MERQQASEEQRRRSALLEENSPVVQQIDLTSSPAGAQIPGPGVTQETTDSDSLSPVREISEAEFHQAPKTGSPGLVETGEELSPGESCVTPLVTPAPVKQALRDTLQSLLQIPPSPVTSDFGTEYQAHGNLAPVLSTVLVPTGEWPRPQGVHLLRCNGVVQIFIANASAEDVRVIRMTCQHLPKGASLEPRASFAEVPLRGGEERAVMLQFNVAALCPVLGKFLTEETASWIVALAVASIWEDSQNAREHTQAALMAPHLEGFSFEEGEPAVALALVKFVLCSRNLELAPGLRDLWQNALFTTIHELLIEHINLALTLGVAASLNKLRNEAGYQADFQPTPFTPTETPEAVESEPLCVLDSRTPSPVLGPQQESLEEVQGDGEGSGLIMRTQYWQALTERERRDIAKMAATWLHEWEGETLQPIVDYLSTESGVIQKLIRVPAIGACMAEAMAVVLMGTTDFAAELLNAATDAIESDPELQEVEAMRGCVQAKDLRRKLLQGSEWGGGTELAVWARTFFVNIRVFVVRRSGLRLMVEVVEIAQDCIENAAWANLFLYEEHYYALVPAEELVVMSHMESSTDLTDNPAPLLTMDLPKLKNTFNLLAQPHKRHFPVPPTAMARLQAKTQQVCHTHIQRQLPPPQIDLTEEDMQTMDPEGYAESQKWKKVWEAMAKAKARAQDQGPTTGAQAHTPATPVVAVTASESGRWVVAAKMSDKGKQKVTTPPGIDRTPAATPSSATSVTSSLVALPGTGRQGTRMNLSTGRGCAGNGTVIFNRRVLKGITYLSRHAEWSKDTFWLKATTTVLENGQMRTYRLTMAGTPPVLYEALLMVDPKFELYLLAKRASMGIYVTKDGFPCVSQDLTQEEERRSLKKYQRQLWEEHEVLQRLDSLPQLAAKGDPSPISSAHASLDGDHAADEPIDLQPALHQAPQVEAQPDGNGRGMDGEMGDRITPSAVQSDRKVSFAMVLSPPGGNSPTGSPPRRPQGEQGEANNHKVVGVRAVGMMATAAAMHGGATRQRTGAVQAAKARAPAAAAPRGAQRQGPSPPRTPTSERVRTPDAPRRTPPGQQRQHSSAGRGDADEQRQVDMAVLVTAPSQASSPASQGAAELAGWASEHADSPTWGDPALAHRFGKATGAATPTAVQPPMPPGPPPKGGLLRLSPLQEQARMGPGEQRWLSRLQNDAALTVARDPHLLSQLAAQGGGDSANAEP